MDTEQSQLLRGVLVALPAGGERRIGLEDGPEPARSFDSIGDLAEVRHVAGDLRLVPRVKTASRSG